jgi:PleD family two-component response regulator
VSLGVAMLGEHETSGEELYRRADGLLYEAKQGGRNRVAGYSPRT